jgi:hypothetical protein
MLGKDIIKLIESAHLENHDFCVPTNMVGNLKSSAITLYSWDHCEKIGERSYNTNVKGNSKVAILTNLE